MLGRRVRRIMGIADVIIVMASLRISAHVWMSSPIGCSHLDGTGQRPYGQSLKPSEALRAYLSYIHKSIIPCPNYPMPQVSHANIPHISHTYIPTLATGNASQQAKNGSSNPSSGSTTADSGSYPGTIPLRLRLRIARRGWRRRCRR